MLRVKCTSCGRTIKGGDDWSGRSGSCPQCGAIVFFPKIGEDFPSPEALDAVDPHPDSVPRRLLKFVKYPNMGWLSTVVILPLAVASIWIWCQLIIILAYGSYAYFSYGLRVVHLSKTRGIDLSNGQHVGSFWTAIFMSGYLGSWAVLMKAADEAVGRASSKPLVYLLIAFAGGAAGYSLFDQMAHTLYRSGLSHEAGTERPLLMIFILAVVAALTYWRLTKSPEAAAKNQPRDRQ